MGFFSKLFSGKGNSSSKSLKPNPNQKLIDTIDWWKKAIVLPKLMSDPALFTNLNEIDLGDSRVLNELNNLYKTAFEIRIQPYIVAINLELCCISFQSQHQDNEEIAASHTLTLKNVILKDNIEYWNAVVEINEQVYKIIKSRLLTQSIDDRNKRKTVSELVDNYDEIIELLQESESDISQIMVTRRELAPDVMIDEFSGRNQMILGLITYLNESKGMSKDFIVPLYDYIEKRFKEIDMIRI